MRSPRATPAQHKRATPVALTTVGPHTADSIMTTATTEETKNVPQDVKEPVKDASDAATEVNNKPDGDKKPAADKEEKEAAPAAPVEPPQPKFPVKKQNFEKDIVYLYQFSRTPVIPSMSPYCLKVETWLRLAGLKYEVSTRVPFCRGGATVFFFTFRFRACTDFPVRVVLFDAIGFFFLYLCSCSLFVAGFFRHRLNPRLSQFFFANLRINIIFTMA